jgi:hypothetical protein
MKLARKKRTDPGIVRRANTSTYVVSYVGAKLGSLMLVDTGGFVLPDQDFVTSHPIRRILVQKAPLDPASLTLPEIDSSVPETPNGVAKVLLLLSPSMRWVNLRIDTTKTLTELGLEIARQQNLGDVPFEFVADDPVKRIWRDLSSSLLIRDFACGANEVLSMRLLDKTYCFLIGGHHERVYNFAGGAQVIDAKRRIMDDFKLDSPSDIRPIFAEAELDDELGLEEMHEGEGGITPLIRAIKFGAGFHMDFENVREIRELQSDQNGVVRLVEDSKNGTFVLKTRIPLPGQEFNIGKHIQETAFLAKLCHPCILRMIG